MSSGTLNRMTVAQALDRLEKYYGKLGPPGPSDPYEMVLYANCGYPANDITCRKGFDALRDQVGPRPEQILAASEAKLAAIMRLGGIMPELRATRLKQIAAVVQESYSGNLASVLKKPLPEAKKALKQFPTIGDPGAEKILLFTKTAPVAAVPAAFVHVLHRLGFGKEAKSYSTGYRSAQEAIRAGLPQECTALLRAYLLFQRHGRELCKRSRPMCRSCPLARDCTFFQGRK
jgi:endonuclease III